MGYDEMTMAAFAAATEEAGPESLPMPRYVGHAGNPPGQGPFIEVHLSLSPAGQILSAFRTYGCPACIACSQTVCALVRGKSLAEARAVGESTLKERVGELPRAKRHCIGFALEALNHALDAVEAGAHGRAASVGVESAQV
jgi:tRNA-specific 2-thiouridylase